ncbi:hypothetical protein P43SY_010160 [Pythium insidiosum]|uniref:TRUD domain-containing protein n=1 Tax=Pythium insidiosum TaxID=114742 RepID=A0AAD5LNY6_PYTIN|nr:hypothetical protein P43SY_010160 [Pythium insidiosum]
MGRGAHFSSRGRGGGGRGRGGGRSGGRSGGRGGAPSRMAAFRDPGYNDGVPKSVEEPVVGILRFLTPDVRGFHGTIKERYSDFVVREVDVHGAVVRLSDVKLAMSKEQKKELKISEIVKKHLLSFLCEPTSREDKAALPPNDGVNGEFRVNNRVRGLVGRISGRVLGLFNENKRQAAAAGDRLNIKQLRDVVEEVCDLQTADALTAFLQKLLEMRLAEQRSSNVEDGEAAESSNASVPQEELEFFFPEIAEKERRVRIHQSLRELGERLVVSDTVANANGVSVIRVRRLVVNGKKRKDIDGRSNRNRWPADRPNFLQFVLYKRNMETMSVMSQIGRAMGVNASSFTFAGTKDKRGITTQLVTVYRGSIEKLEALNRARKNLDDFNFVVGNPTYVSDRLKLGDLSGNRFSLAIRSLPSDDVISDEEIHRAVESWATRGFINYFGLQRFGTRSVATHEVGRAILRRDHKQVIDLIMNPQEGDATKITEARKHFQEHRDIDAAIQAFPPYYIAEHSVLRGLKTHGATAYSNAIACIPRHLRMMYTHSFQSYVWNMVASDRLDRYSTTEPVVGDLVLPVDASEDVPLVEDATPELDDVAKEDEPIPEDSSKKRKTLPKERPDVIVVTEENRSAFTIYDVVLPLPGYDIKLPENDLKDRYEEILQRDGVDFSALSRATNSEYHLPGSYRHLIRRPIDVVHEIKRYNDPTIPLVETDIDALQCRKAAASVPDGQYRALCLEFQLKPSSYATMAVRELMKQSSNVSAQLALKDECK